MCSNHSSTWYMNLCRRFPDNTGWLIGPTHWKNPKPEVPFAMDNDAYICFKNGQPYDFCAWSEFLQKVKASGLQPLWSVVPDVVGNATKTLEQWHMFYPEVAFSHGWWEVSVSRFVEAHALGI